MGDLFVSVFNGQKSVSVSFFSLCLFFFYASVVKIVLVFSRKFSILRRMPVNSTT